MTDKDASFLLGSFRPNGADSSDPEFAGALAQASSDPVLNQWFQDQRRFDSAIATRLQSLPVPDDLRSRILTGGRVSRPAHWWMPRRILAIAAMVALFAGLALWFYSGSQPPDQWQDQALATLSGLVSGRMTFDVQSPNVAELQQWLRANGSPVPGALPASLQRLAGLGCKMVSWRGHPISIICFHGPGSETVHLAMTPLSTLDNPSLDSHPLYASRDGWHIALWSQGDMAMMLATKAPESQLRALLAIILP